MKKTMLIVLALLGLMVQGMSAQTIKSPDGKILVFLELKDGGKPFYRVNYQGRFPYWYGATVPVATLHGSTTNFSMR